MTDYNAVLVATDTTRDSPPGTLIRVKPEWMHQYRKPGVTMSGVVKALSPSGKIVRVQMDELGDSYFAVEHVQPGLG